MKKKSVIRRLLFSALAMLLYMAIFFGSTLAWYSDSGILMNTFTFGTLSVQLGKNGDQNWYKSMKIGFLDQDGQEMTEDLLVEPGVTFALQTIYVYNDGTVPMNYRFSVRYSKGTGDYDLYDVMELTVKVKDEPIQPLAGYVSRLEAGEKSTPIQIYMHMKEDAGNEYQNLELNDLTITVFAYQDGMTEQDISEAQGKLQ